MKDSTGNTSYKTAIEILRLYFNTGLPKKLKNEVKSWLVSDFHAEEKQAALWELWENIDIKDENNRKKAWKTIKQKVGLKNAPVYNLNYKRVLQITAACLFIPFVFLATIYYRNTSYGEKIKETYIQIQTEITENEPHHILLADGSEVWLNRRSEFSYGNGRETSLKGEALFNIKKNEEEYFIIHINDIKIIVIGTNFNVSAYPEDEEISVTLYEGILEFATPDTSVRIEPGNQLTFNRNLRIYKRHKLTSQNPVGKEGL